MDRAVALRALASALAFVLIMAGQTTLSTGLFALWTGGLLLAANALYALVAPHLMRGDRFAVIAGAWQDLTAGGSRTTVWPGRPPVEQRLESACALERELDELQAQLTTLGDQLATEQSNRKAA